MWIASACPPVGLSNGGFRFYYQIRYQSVCNLTLPRKRDEVQRQNVNLTKLTMRFANLQVSRAVCYSVW
jgi:hypothetical protein